ncbi:protein CURVATURE THYLAKOID 1D, chloroplastic-like [Prosopis cineraria]|uniref:protein CURVATURE THYLAKOID 1D, chloroplastic-like n=1 Tax=Prosopis cineraria TaxID=364024 RepID=UPI00240FC981|nr:protein CURVATURE THYLAKOID 1D, chloroplastic-like [Prosopis cineraria]XP_054775991.1 protein CURVATURE THYLAKOID 1D, chloroplastic-like [Prosopis cineraria]
MELCTVQAMFKLSHNNAFCTAIPPDSHPLPKPFLSLRKTPVIRTADNMLSRSTSLLYVSPRAKLSDETSGGPSQYFNEKPDRAIIMEDVRTTENNAFSGNVADEETKEESPVHESAQPFDFAEKLDSIKFDLDDTGSIILYGGGAVIALWLTSAVVGAIDSIPLIPKLLEVVGLAYTLWFTSRYLLFKKNRDELAMKIEELKAQVLGYEDD